MISPDLYRYVAQGTARSFQWSEVSEFLSESGWRLEEGQREFDFTVGRWGWREPRSSARLWFVVAAVDPVAVAVGWWPDAEPAVGQVRRVGRVLTTLDARASEWGLRICDRNWFATVLAKADERERVLAAGRQRARELEVTLGHRQCSRCLGWSSFRAVWCRVCEYRFTVADDAARDAREYATVQKCVDLLAGRDGDSR